MYKTVFVESRFLKFKKPRNKKVPTGETKKNLLGFDKKIYKKEQEWVETGEESGTEIDGEKLARDIENVVNDQAINGYEIIYMNPVTSGSIYAYKNFETVKNKGMPFSVGGYGYGYGFGYTAGIIIIFRKSL